MTADPKTHFSKKKKKKMSSLGQNFLSHFINILYSLLAELSYVVCKTNENGKHITRMSEREGHIKGYHLELIRGPENHLE